jgi:outer membrane protein OmpA-like peptidoglycan-associated protein
LQGIQFASGKSNIKPTSYGILNQIANILILNPTYKVEVQGHSDNTGKADKNLALSEARASVVRQYIIDKGMSENRITSKGFGDTKPVASNKTLKGRSMNRRTEFIVSFMQ